jgi:hypothetical protein
VENNFAKIPDSSPIYSLWRRPSWNTCFVIDVLHVPTNISNHWTRGLLFFVFRCRDHSRPQSHFHSVTRWKLGSGLHDQMERSDWLLREPANYHAH